VSIRVYNGICPPVIYVGTNPTGARNTPFYIYATTGIAGALSGSCLHYTSQYLAIKSAFFPLVEAALHSSHLFSSGTLRSLGSLPCKEAPGTSASRKLIKRLEITVRGVAL